MQRRLVVRNLVEATRNCSARIRAISTVSNIQGKSSAPSVDLSSIVRFAVKSIPGPPPLSAVQVNQSDNFHFTFGPLHALFRRTGERKIRREAKCRATDGSYRSIRKQSVRSAQSTFFLGGTTLITNSQPHHSKAIPSIPKNLRIRKGRLSIDLPIDSFQTAYVNFSNAAEAFWMSLSDPLDRQFACRYLAYVQGIALGSELPKPYVGRPSWSLIRSELERLFRSHLSRPDSEKPDR